jgi:tetratricopeptide (TPR) repeat protein
MSVPMNDHARPVRIVIGFVVLALATLLAASAAADDNGAMREAGKHFQRGVALYGEADYRAALVEFKRAYATSPNVAVLYNVGETEYQLQDYANALTTFERYLTEAGASESHRGEVESTMDILRARVGHLTITTSPPGAEVTVDDQPIGRTPFDRSLLVSIGRRKVVASMAGRSPVSRYVDVAADDNAAVSLQLGSGESSSAAALLQQLSSSKAESTTPSSAGPALRTLGWVVTAASAVGAGTFGILAIKESNDLAAARASYPTTAATLTHDANLTTTYSILADSLTAAAVIIGGVTLYSTLSSSSPSGSKRGSRSGGPSMTRVSVGPGSARFEMTF